MQGKDSTAYTGGLVGGGEGGGWGGGGEAGDWLNLQKGGQSFLPREREDKRIDADRILSSLADTNQIVQRVLRQNVA